MNPATHTHSLSAPQRIFWTAFLLRVLYITLAHTYRIRPLEGHFQFGWEAGRIAKALVTGYGYADPFSNAVLAHTGPTAWLPPVYPLLIAAVFKLFGVYTPASAWVLLAINSALSAATALAIWEIAARCFSHRVALWSAWIWALHPAALQYAVRWIWEMSLTTALFTWTLVFALRLRNVQPVIPTANAPYVPAKNHVLNDDSTLLWLLFGLFWALIALANSTLLLFLPICGLWILLGRQSHSLRNAVLAAILFLSCLFPWVYRNHQVFHTFIPLRSNFGAELYLGNGPGSTGLLMEYDHPFRSPRQLLQYARLGELPYVAGRGALAKAYIRTHPAHFADLTLRRVFFYWWSVPDDASHAWIVSYLRVLDFSFISLSGLLGLALALYLRTPAAKLFAWAFALLPLTYYFVTVHARFRHPLEPLLCILAVFLFLSAQPRRSSSVDPAAQTR